MKEIEIKETSGIVNRMILSLPVPDNIHITGIKREDKFVIPVGTTMIKAGDILFIPTEDKDNVQEIYGIFKM